MDRPIRILYVDDYPLDRELVRDALEKENGGFQLTEATSRADFETRLAEDKYDLVLSDFNILGFEGLQVIDAVHVKHLRLPVIIVTGTGSEEIAVEALKRGAVDYVIKTTKHIRRLPQVIRAVLDKQRLEEEQMRMEEAYRTLVEHSLQGFLIYQQGRIVFANQAVSEIFGYTTDELVSLPSKQVSEIVYPDDRTAVMGRIQARLAGKPTPSRYEYRIVRKNGEVRWLEQSAILIEYQGKPAIQTTVYDLTERKRAEEALRESEARYRTLAEAAHDNIFIFDRGGIIEYVNQFGAEQFGRQPEEIVGQKMEALFPPEVSHRQLDSLEHIFQTRKPYYAENISVFPHGELWEATWLSPLFDETGEVRAVLGIARDITRRKQRERELEAIVTVSTALRMAETRAEMLPILLDQLLILLNADGASFEMIDSVTGDVLTELGRGIWASTTGERIPPGKGLTAQVVATHRLYINNDVRADPALFHPDLIGECRAVAGVPLIAREQIIGLLWVARKTDITDSDLRLLSAVVDIAANAIHRATLHEQTARQLDRLAAVHSIDQVIGGSLNLHVTLDILLQHVITQLRVDAAVVLLLDSHLNTLEFAAARGFRGSGITRLSLRLGEDYAGKVALERRFVNIPDLSMARQKFTKAHLTVDEDFVAYYGVPVVAKGQVKGVLEIFHRAPLSPDPEWLEFLETLAGQAAIAIDNAELFNGLQSVNSELILSYDATIEGWSRALDLRDKETEGHTQRVVDLTLHLGRAMGVNDAELVHVRRGALLHDIGKMAIPDSILLKPEALTAEEWEIMRKHPEYANRLLSPIAYLRPALDIPYCHHEKWDGTGYPRGLTGEQIPLVARIFAVVDVWDALRSDRPYRKAWSRENALKHIRELAGTQFDPKVVVEFFKLEL